MSIILNAAVRLLARHLVVSTFSSGASVSLDWLDWVASRRSVWC